MKQDSGLTENCRKQDRRSEMRQKTAPPSMCGTTILGSREDSHNLNLPS